MNVLMVYAHHEPQSFNAALLARAIEALHGQGHDVQVSDLYAMDFNPVAAHGDFTQRRFPDMLQYDREQKFAHEHNAFAPEIQVEIDKLLWSDVLILQFPLWWFSVPAILKGWIDRVFVNGVAYGKGRRMETGGLKGRRAMLAVSTGCFEDMVAPDGLLGDLSVILWHLHAGTLAYAGLEVLPTPGSARRIWTPMRCACSRWRPSSPCSFTRAAILGPTGGSSQALRLRP
jgi:NAD(P)H dehydrogenase (quinone)